MCGPESLDIKELFLFCTKISKNRVVCVMISPGKNMDLFSLPFLTSETSIHINVSDECLTPPSVCWDQIGNHDESTNNLQETSRIV